MEASFILIPGRSSRQGTSLNVGKYSEEYRSETATLLVNAADMERLNLQDGDAVRLTSCNGTAELVCKQASGDEVPPGLLFLAYGPPVCALIGGETHGTGMPDSKGIDVQLEKI